MAKDDTEDLCRKCYRPATHLVGKLALCGRCKVRWDQALDARRRHRRAKTAQEMIADEIKSKIRVPRQPESLPGQLSLF
jgi:hypothetical protein